MPTGSLTVLFFLRFENRSRSALSTTRPFVSLLDRPSLLARPWLVSGLQWRLSSALLIHTEISSLCATLNQRCCAASHSPCSIVDIVADVQFGIHYAICNNLADIHASCRAVTQNATYRDFGTSHIPATLTFGAPSGSTRIDGHIEYESTNHEPVSAVPDPNASCS